MIFVFISRQDFLEQFLNVYGFPQDIWISGNDLRKEGEE